MAELFKVSGKKAELPAAPAGWAFERRPGGWVIAVSPTGSRHRFQLAELKGMLSANLGGLLMHGQVHAQSRGGSGGGGSDADLVAQFPGKVRKLLVSDGATVKEGDSLLLVEAMKMEFAVKAPYDGVVKKMLVTEGQQLSPGTKFVDLEASGGK